MTFIIIQLPPGDFVTAMVAQLNLQGTTVDPAEMAALRARYGLDDSLWVQYWKWISNIVLRGDFGFSLEWRRPVADLLWNRLGLTFVLALATLIFIWALSIPIGIYSAVRKNTAGDYFASFVGVIGLADPELPVGAGADVHRVPLLRRRASAASTRPSTRMRRGAGASSPTSAAT